MSTILRVLMFGTLTLSPLLGAAAEPASTNDEPAAAAGQRAYVDPSTGQLASPPDGYVEPESDAASAKDAPVPMELTRSTSGHTMLKTHGRIHATAVASIDSHGVVHTDCVEGLHDHADGAARAQER